MSCLCSVGFCSKMSLFDKAETCQYDNFTFNRTHVLEVFFAQIRPSNPDGLTLRLTVWDANSRSHGFAS